MKNKKRISFLELMKAFEVWGFSFHAFGSVKENGKKVATFYKGDPLKQETRDKLKAAIPNVFFLGAGCT